MLINFNEIKDILSRNNINITGAFHVGAFECEELSFYDILNLRNEDVLWIDANETKVNEARSRGIPNVYQALITDTDDKMEKFNITNNGMSSSVLELGTHAVEHPHVFYVNHVNLTSVTIDTFFKRNNINPSKYNFWNFDIQGAELMALKGATSSLHYAKPLYLEVNEKELYLKCGLINEIDEFLNKYNFKRVLTNITQHGWGDALYIRN